MSGSDRPECVIAAEERDAQGCLPIGRFSSFASDCEIPSGTCFSVPVSRPPGLIAVRRAPRKPKKSREVVMESVSVTPVPEAPPLAPSIASVGIPENALAEVKALVPAGEQASGMTVLLAVVGVAGGGAAVKFYRDFAKNKHEQAMKKLDIEQQRSEKQEDQHSQCNAARAVLEAKVVALEAKVVELGKPREDGFDLDFDADDLKSRLDKLEKALGTAKPAARRRRS